MKKGRADIVTHSLTLGAHVQRGLRYLSLELKATKQLKTIQSASVQKVLKFMWQIFAETSEFGSENLAL